MPNPGDSMSSGLFGSKPRGSEVDFSFFSRPDRRVTEGTILVRGDFFLESFVLTHGTQPKLEGLKERPAADDARRREPSVALGTDARPD